VVDVDEDDGERLEPDVQQTVDEGDVEVEQEGNRFCETDGERFDESHLDDLAACHAFSIDLGLALKVEIAREFAIPGSPSIEDVAGTRFRQAERQEDQTEP